MLQFNPLLRPRIITIQKFHTKTAIYHGGFLVTIYLSLPLLKSNNEVFHIPYCFWKLNHATFYMCFCNLQVLINKRENWRHAEAIWCLGYQLNSDGDLVLLNCFKKCTRTGVQTPTLRQWLYPVIGDIPILSPTSPLFSSFQMWLRILIQWQYCRNC